MESIVIKCINLFPNFQRGTPTQKDKKSFQSLIKKGPKIEDFWTPWDIWWRYRQTLQAICLKFCMQVPICKGHICAKFQLSNQTFNFFICPRGSKNSKFWDFFFQLWNDFLSFWVGVPLWKFRNKLIHLMTIDSLSGRQ